LCDGDVQSRFQTQPLQEAAKIRRKGHRWFANDAQRDWAFEARHEVERPPAFHLKGEIEEIARDIGV